MPIPDLWIPPKIDIDNLPDIDDPELAIRKIRQAQDYMIIHEGVKDGLPFTLVSWMWLAEWQLNGLLNPDGTRRIREMFILIPKKNAKSPYLGWKAVQQASLDEEPNAKVACVSSSVKQAAYMFKPIEYAIANHPLLRTRFRPMRSENRIEYYGIHPVFGDMRLQGEIHKRTGDPTGQQGGSWSTVLFDESSEMLGPKGQALFSTYTAGTGRARRQPLIITCTTANTYQEGSLYQDQRAQALRALKNPDDYPDYLPIVYVPTPEEEKGLRAKKFPSAEVIARLNPGVDEVTPLSVLITEAKKAFVQSEYLPRKWDDVLRFMFNLDVDELQKWMKSHVWNACENPNHPDVYEQIEADKKLPPDEQPEWFIGMDLAPVDDISSWVAIRAPKKYGETVMIWAWAYLPEEKVKAHAGLKQKEKDKKGKDKPVRKDAARYLEWAEAGWLTLVQGKVNDDARVIGDVKEFIELVGDVGAFAYDPAHAKRVYSAMHDDNYGNRMFPVKNTFEANNEPCGDLMKHAINGYMSHGGNPLMTWCVLNLVMITDTNRSIKPVKNRAGDKIDVAIALILAWIGWFASRDGDYF
jgi:phage terminase large subunit-like protein